MIFLSFKNHQTENFEFEEGPHKKILSAPRLFEPS